MKTRAGFVSNSSSSSFVLKRAFIGLHQINLIMDYQKAAEQVGMEMDYPEWRIDLGDQYIHFNTSMDNFDMYEFLDRIGVPEEAFDCEWHS